MAPGEQAYEYSIDYILLPYYDFADLIPDAIQSGDRIV